MCRLFSQHRIIERTNLDGGSGEFTAHIDRKRKSSPLIDHHGNECWWTDLLFIIDPRFPIGDPRHDVASEVNRHRTDDDVIGGSGKWDPSKSQLQIDGIVYRKHKTNGGRIPTCTLCEGGDMIPPSERFRDSTYRPGEDDVPE